MRALRRQPRADTEFATVCPNVGGSNGNAGISVDRAIRQQENSPPIAAVTLSLANRAGKAPSIASLDVWMLDERGGEAAIIQPAHPKCLSDQSLKRVVTE